MKAPQSEPRTTERRQFISEQLELSKSISFAAIRERFPNNADRASLHADVMAMRKAGIPVSIGGGKRERRIILETSRKITSKKAYRAGWMTQEKENIAAVAAALIFGNTRIVRSEKLADGGRDPEKMETYEITRDQIEKAIFDSCPEEKPLRKERLDELVNKLRAYWTSNDKAIALDSGTTTDHVAEKIKHFDILKDLDGLNNLTLFTNSRSIFATTGVPECNIKTIIIGGRQRHQTESISGELAMRCLKAWDVSFGMTIVGATGIDVSTLMLGSYNDEEAAMKQALLERGKIRIVVADITKFDRYSFKITSRFARLHHSSIDLVVIDSCPDMEKICPGYRTGIQESNLIRFLNFMDIPVLIADQIKQRRKNPSG